MWLMRSRDQIRRQFQILDRLQFEIWKSRRLDSMITWLNIGHVADAVTWPWSAPISSSRTFSIFLRFQSTETGANFRPFEFNCYRSVRSRDCRIGANLFLIYYCYFFLLLFLSMGGESKSDWEGEGEKTRKFKFDWAFRRARLRNWSLN